MSTVLNDRDAILQAASVRIVNPKNAYINLLSSAPGFHVNAAGQADLSVVTVTAELFGLDDAVTFSAAGATLSNAAGRSVDVTYGGQTAIVTATVVSNGDEFKRSIVIPVLRDGASGTGTPGAPGARGAGHYYAIGTTWSDVIAQAACPGSTPVLNDVVTISSSTYVMEKRWTGSAWVENGVVINGKLIVPDSILTAALGAEVVTARNMAAESVTVRALAITNGGAALNRDPNFTDVAGCWAAGGALQSGVNPGGANVPANTYVFASAGAAGTAIDRQLVPIDPTKTYVLAASAYTDGGNDRSCAFTVDFYDVSNAKIANAGWGDTNYSGLVNVFAPAAGTWASYRSGMFGARAGNGKTIPANARSVRIGVYLNAGGSSNTLMACTALRLEEAVSGVTIEPKGIKAPHIDVEVLSAIIALLGNCQIGAGGALWQGTNQYNAGEGIFIGADNGGKPVLFIGTAGGANMRWSKSEGLRLDQVGLDSFTAWLSGSAGGSYPNNTTGSTGYGFLRAETSGGKLPMTYVWSLIERNRTGAVNRMNISGASSQAASFSGSGSNGSAEYDVTCVVTDGNQRSITLKSTINVNHGTPV